MDVNFWGARFHNMNIPSLHSAPGTGNDAVMEDEVRAWFPCPFCYVEIEVPLLCVHLQQDHCFDFRNAVCPLCAESLGRDALSHFTVQHSHSVKRRRCQKSGWSNGPANGTIRDLRELTSFLSGGNEPVAPDPVLTPFICTVPVNVSRGCLQDDAVAETSDAECSKPSSGEKEAQDYKERNQHAVFLQELLMSTIFQGN